MYTIIWICYATSENAETEMLTKGYALYINIYVPREKTTESEKATFSEGMARILEACLKLKFESRLLYVYQ